MKFENTQVFNFEGALRGMRNPMNSWDKSDSDFSDNCYSPETDKCEKCNYFSGFGHPCIPFIGKNDIALAQKLIRAGTEHRKFLRQILISVDITAPLYWWKEFDTYKVGTTANSTSTMHKLSSTPITLKCFDFNCVTEKLNNIDNSSTGLNVAESVCNLLENYRQEYLRTNNKRIWKALVQLLPSGWLQTRTITMNYENLLSICKQRRHHKLNEWSGCDDPTNPNFIAWARTLPYAKEFIFYDEEQEIE